MMRWSSIAVAAVLFFSVVTRAPAVDHAKPTKAGEGFATPQEAFQAYTKAAANEDWRGLFNCCPPNERGRSLLLVTFLVVGDRIESLPRAAWALHVDWRTAEDLLQSDCVVGGIGLLKMAGVNSEMVLEWSIDARLQIKPVDRFGVWERIINLSEVAWSDEGARILHRAGVDIRAMEEDILSHPPTAKLCGIGEAYFKFLEQEATQQAKPQDPDDFIVHRYFAKVSDPAGLYQQLLGWDASGMSDTDRKMGREQLAQVSTVKLANVVINGDSATGMPIDGASGKPTGGEPLHFKKVHGRWFVESGF